MVLPVPFTFGIVFQFCLGTLKDGHEDPDCDDPRLVNIHKRQPYHPDFPERVEDTYAYGRTDFNVEEFVNLSVQSKIREAGIRARGEMSRFFDCRTQQNMFYDGSAKETSWYITRNPSIRVASTISDHPYEWHQMELKSPAMYHCPGSIAEVKRICQIMTRTFRLHFNDTCGLRVHIGNENHGFDNITMTKLMTFLWAFEPQISSLHPKERHDSVYCESLRKASPLAIQMKCQGRMPYATDALTELYSHNTLPELYKLVNSERTCHAYSLKHLLPLNFGTPNPNEQRTIVFRQHASTFDVYRVAMWIDTVIAIVAFARDSVLPETVKWLYEQTIKEQHKVPLLSIIKILETIGCHGPAAYYSQQLFSQENREWTRERNEIWQSLNPAFLDEEYDDDENFFDPF